MSDLYANVTAYLTSRKQCLGWLEGMTDTYKCGALYRQVLHSMEQLSKRELRDETQIQVIIASRRGSRASSPINGTFGKPIIGS